MLKLVGLDSIWNHYKDLTVLTVQKKIKTERCHILTLAICSIIK